jgi:hypothetical protein
MGFELVTGFVSLQATTDHNHFFNSIELELALEL